LEKKRGFRVALLTREEGGGKEKGERGRGVFCWSCNIFSWPGGGGKKEGWLANLLWAVGGEGRGGKKKKLCALFLAQIIVLAGEGHDMGKKREGKEKTKRGGRDLCESKYFADIWGGRRKIGAPKGGGGGEKGGTPVYARGKGGKRKKSKKKSVPDASEEEKRKKGGGGDPVSPFDGFARCEGKKGRGAAGGKKKKGGKKKGRKRPSRRFPFRPFCAKRSPRGKKKEGKGGGKG